MTVSLVFSGQDGAQAGAYENLLSLTLSFEQPGVNAAPSAVWFDCTAVAGAAARARLPGEPDVYDPQYHEITYLWDFDDPANARPKTTQNMPDVWKDQNKGYGRRVAHVYNSPGSYTVTCYAYEPATRRFGSRTIPIIVENPDSVFADNRTIIYDPANRNWSARYPNAPVRTTWSAVNSTRDALGLTRGRILFAPGATLALGAADDNITASGWLNLRIGALDPDHVNRPVIRSAGRQGEGQNEALVKDTEPNCIEAVIHDIDFQGEWDAATETGRILRPFSINKSNLTGNTHLFMLHRCTLTGFEAVRGQFLMKAGGLAYAIYSDTSVTNWQDYGITSGIATQPRMETALVGVSAAQHVSALSGGPKNGFYNNHGPLRDFGSNHLYIGASEFFSRNGWSTGGTFNGLSIPADQAAIRINTVGASGKSSYLDRVTAEGYIWMEEQNSTSVDVPGNHLLDKVLQVAGSRLNLGTFVNARFGGTTVRNYLGLKLNLPEAGNLTTSSFLNLSNTRGNAQNGPAGVRVYNSTGVDLRSDTHARDAVVTLTADGGVAFPVKVTENNLMHAPNRSASVPVQGESLNLGAVTAGFAPRHKGPRFNFQHEEGALSDAVSGSGGTLTLPYSQITTQQLNLSGTETAPATNQAYWQAIEATDRLHRIAVDGVMYHADRAQIAVSFTSAGVSIANTSGTTWPAGAQWQLRLDRTSRLPGFDPQYDSTTQSLAITVAATDGGTRDPADMGARAYDDFLGTARPAVGNVKGALL